MATFSDKAVNAALTARWVSEGGEPGDGYSVQRTRQLFDMAMRRLARVRLALRPPIDPKTLGRALDALSGIDKEYPGFYFADIVDNADDIADVLMEER